MTAHAPKLRFSVMSPFHADLKRRVDAYFASTGRSPQGGFAMWLKTATLLAWLLGSYAVLLFCRVSPWQAVLLVASIGLAMAGIGFAVQHDANHGAYSSSPRVNGVMSVTLDLLGASSHLWRLKHNVMHHTYTNVSGLDDDLESGSPHLRLAPWQPRRRFHRLQHLYVWILYAAFPLKWWFVDDLRELMSGRLGRQAFAPARGWTLVRALALKAAFVSWAFVIPAVLHPTWALVPLWAIGVSTLGIVLASVFQLAHCVDEAEFCQPDSAGAAKPDWAEHQVSTTVDFARGNRLLSWYLGGLNFQVEHHLFPRICHLHYRALSSIVEETCRAHSVRYRAEPTLGGALAANFRWLRRMGAPAAASA
ncbi:MAG: fatty acid desaturase family protein [Myxococcales bacterium]